ncbi:helix-turn-helix domain-containing protein [Deinococcus sp. UYEF24]
MKVTPKATIQYLLEQRGMTQGELGELVGLSPAVISHTLASPSMTPKPLARHP